MPKLIFANSGPRIVFLISVVVVIFILGASLFPVSLYQDHANEAVVGGATLPLRSSTTSNTGISDSNPYRSESQFASEMNDLNNLGIGWIRIDFSWTHVQPLGPKTYDWNLYDMYVRVANAHNIKVLGILDYAPGWAAASGCSRPTSCAPASTEAFATYAENAAVHFKGSVNNWELWNEENSSFWSPQPDAYKYAQLVKQSYAKIKGANPDATVILGGLSPNVNPSKNEVDATAFLQDLYADGIKDSFDAVAYHPYTYPATPLTSTGVDAWNKMQRLYDIMVTQGDGSKKVWISEFGAPTNGPNSSRYVSEDYQAQEVTDLNTALAARPWIGNVFWYTYRDFGTDSSIQENFFGLRRVDGSPKPAYNTLKNILDPK